MKIQEGRTDDTALICSGRTSVEAAETSHLTGKQQPLGSLSSNPNFIIVNRLQATRLIWAV